MSPTTHKDLMARAVLGGDKLFTPQEVSILFRVDPKTVTRWAKAGKLPAIKTLGGHRRYRESDVQALLEASQEIGPEAA